jgi:hypothetical protein
MEQSQEHVVATRADRVETDTVTGPWPELSYPMAQTIAVLITGGVLIVFTLLFALLTG